MSSEEKMNKKALTVFEPLEDQHVFERDQHLLASTIVALLALLQRHDDCKLKGLVS